MGKRVNFAIIALPPRCLFSYLIMLSAPIDLHLVRQLFSAPDKIHASDFLRREIAARMRERLELVKIQPQTILDAGCGEGLDTPELQKKYPAAQVIGVDASLSMLAVAQNHQRMAQGTVNRLLNKWAPAAFRASSNTGLICADFARLPCATAGTDLLWSNLALHWHPQPDIVFAEWRRVLRTEGLLMFSCFGPDTLIELREAYAKHDQHPHTIPFVDMHDFGDMLVNTGFSTPVMDMEKITITYSSVEKLFSDIRAFGGNPLMTRRRGLTGKHLHRAVCQTLEQTRNADGVIPLTFEVIYGHAFRPVSRKTAAGESIIRFDSPKRNI